MSTNVISRPRRCRIHCGHQAGRRWWIGWIEEVPGVNCQERSRDKLLDSLKVALREALEMNRRTPAPLPAKTSRK